ncbi:MAG TPA: hypothetical protein VF152_05470, partial [Acidimicrobiia bacterium]
MRARVARGIVGATAALLLGLAASLAPAPLGPAPAGAGEGSPPAGGPAEPGIELVSMDRSSLEPGDAALLELAVGEAGADLEVWFEAHQVIRSRITYERTLEGEDLGSTVDTVSFPLADLPRTATGTVAAPLAIQDPGQPADPSRLPLRELGVYPIEVQLRDADANVLASFVLPIVIVVPNADGSPVVGERLRVAWVWPLVAAPARLPFGQPDPAVVDELRPDGRLGRQAATLAGAGDVPFTVAPGPETLGAWQEFAAADADLQESLDAMNDALATNQKLASPYVDLNVPSLLDNGLRAQVGTERAYGTETLSRLVETRVDPRTALVEPVDNTAVAYLRESQVDRMILDGDALVPVESDFTPARPFTLETGGLPTTAVATNPGLSAPLTATGPPPALRAQQFLAGLSVVALELPNSARGLVVVNPTDWDPPAELLEAAVTGLRGHRLVQAVDIEQFFAQVPPATGEDSPAVRTLEPYDPPRPPVTAAQYL